MKCITETHYDGNLLSIPNKAVSWGDKYTKLAGTCTITTNGKTSSVGAFRSNTYELQIVNENNSRIVCVATSALASNNESFKNMWKSACP